MNYVKSSESVSIGHPDKACDQISDAIVDAYLAKDPQTKVAIECMITNQHLILAGEVSSTSEINVVDVARKTLESIGYVGEEADFNPSTASYKNLIHQQSREINQSVSQGGAGDQGHVFGYATKETSELLPLPYLMAIELMKAHAQARQSIKDNPLLADAKAQVSVEYKNDQPVAVKSIILSSQHKPGLGQLEVKDFIKTQLINPLLEKFKSFVKSATELLINSSGSFTQGGPLADTGLTGRKIIVDTYGGFCSHGGGAFSGKDGSKIDRSAAYAARYLAKHLVWAGIADKCEIEIAYAIGRAQPVAFHVDTLATGSKNDDEIAKLLQLLFDLRPNHLIYRFGLDQPIFENTAKYGHFTNERFPWEKKDEDLIREIKRIMLPEAQNGALEILDLKKHREAFPKGGYFRFPYIIIAPQIAGPALRMQIPIHLLAEGEAYDEEKHKGTILNDVSPDVLKLSDKERNEALLEEMKKLTEQVVNKILKDGRKIKRACLVLDKNTAYDLQEGKWILSPDIPTGGTLITQMNEVIHIDKPHFIE
jgi:S-adenosylmethionine synthetase